MGCAESNRLNLTPEETLLSKTISSISYPLYPIILLKDQFSQTDQSMILEYKSLKHILNLLEFSAEGQKFFKYLSKSGQLSWKKVLALLTVLGKQNLPEKLKIIFEIYSDENNDSLMKSEGELMISHLLQIHLQFIPMYVQRLNEKNAELVKYCAKFSVFNNILLKTFTKQIFKRMLEIDLIMFIHKVIDNWKLELLLDGEKLRKYCIGLFEEEMIGKRRLGRHSRSKTNPDKIEEEKLKLS